MFGFGAVGVWVVGTGPFSGGPAPLIVTTGAYTLTGKAITFEGFEAAAQVAFTLTGIAAPAQQQAAAARGTFAETGEALTFETFMAEATGSFHLMGWAGPLLAGAGSFAWTGYSVTFLTDIDVGVIIGMGGEPGEYALTGYRVTMQTQLPEPTCPYDVDFNMVWAPEIRGAGASWPAAAAAAGTWAPPSAPSSVWSGAGAAANTWAPAGIPGTDWGVIDLDDPEGVPEPGD